MRQSKCIVEGSTVYAQAWMDSKPVHMLSSFPVYIVPTSRNTIPFTNRITEGTASFAKRQLELCAQTVMLTYFY